MTTRRERARELADHGRVVKQDDCWLVFSLSSSEKYHVTLHPESCTCPDYDQQRDECKHILAVKLGIRIKSSDARPG
jgi:hypothetical protein